MTQNQTKNNKRTKKERREVSLLEEITSPYFAWRLASS